MTVPVFRFAPSPNGHLHLGHAYSALLNQQMARDAGGRLLLRMEDIDRERCTPELEQTMQEDLHWIGFDWEKPVRRQSEHFAVYSEALDRLIDMELVYPAFLSRGEIKSEIENLGGNERLAARSGRSPALSANGPAAFKRRARTAYRRRTAVFMAFEHGPCA